jgi:ribosome-binding protein aMBF1 (putative translation factor)
MRCDMCGASQAKTKKIMWGGNMLRACTDGGKINVRTGERISCYQIYTEE